jgi:glyoxylase-like metal-dependent hydrolase (beta-lactamase superfamily II)
MTIPEYEVYALKFAERDGRRTEHFLGGDPHDAPMSTAYYVWVIRDGKQTILVDTGFDEAMAVKRRRRMTMRPAEALARLGVPPESVTQTVITHLHNDHAGTVRDFPNAKFHLQDHEMRYATGRYMTNETFSRAYEVDHVVDMVRLVYDRRVAFHRGDEEIAPGVSLHHIGGHTAGIQSVRVHTRRGWVVLASDTAHYYENFERRRPYPIVFSVGDMADGYERLAALAESPQHVIPGHDPRVMERYSAPRAGLEGIAVSLHEDMQAQKV